MIKLWLDGKHDVDPIEGVRFKVNSTLRHGVGENSSPMAYLQKEDGAEGYSGPSARVTKLEIADGVVFVRPSTA